MKVHKAVLVTGLVLLLALTGWQATQLGSEFIPRLSEGALVLNEAQQRIAKEVDIPDGYVMEWGGQFKNLERAKNRLLLVVPATLLLVFLMLFFSMKNLRDVLLIYTGIPFAGARDFRYRCRGFSAHGVVDGWGGRSAASSRHRRHRWGDDFHAPNAPCLANTLQMVCQDKRSNKSGNLLKISSHFE